MNVPLARLLSRFDTIESPLKEPFIADPRPEPDPVATMIEEQVAAALQACEADHARQIAGLTLAHHEAIDRAIAETRTDCCVKEAEALTARLEDAIAELKAYLSDKIADALKPLLGKAATMRTRDVLMETLDLVLTDPNHPPLTVWGPGDLIDVIRIKHAEATGIEFIPHDEIDAIVKGDGLRIETRLEAALAILANAEH